MQENYYFEHAHGQTNKNGVLLVEYTVKEPLCCVPHIHTVLELVYFIDGTYTVLCDDKEYTAKSGDVVLFRSNSIHRMYCFTPECGRYYVLHISLEQILSFAFPGTGNKYLLSLSFCHRNSKSFWSSDECKANGLSGLFERLISIYHRDKYASDIAAKLCCGEIIYTMLCDIGEESADIEDANNLARSIYDVINYINKHFAENLTAKECSKNAALSYSYFSRNFKRITGTSFKDYLNMVRIAHAEKLLLSTDLSIAQITEECGFNSQSYFIAEYKRQKNVTPHAFRKAMKNEII